MTALDQRAEAVERVLVADIPDHKREVALLMLGLDERAVEAMTGGYGEGWAAGDWPVRPAGGHGDMAHERVRGWVYGAPNASRLPARAPSTNCRNCGAPPTPGRCAYCDTPNDRAAR